MSVTTVDFPPPERLCARHNVKAQLVGVDVDYDGLAVYKCPNGHGLREDGAELSLHAVGILSKYGGRL